MITMRKQLKALALAVLLGACGDLTVPDYNNPSVDDINSNPSTAGIAAAAQGLLRGTRDNAGGMVSTLGMFGREGWLMSTTGGGLSSAVRDPLVGSGGAGAGLWSGSYRNMRNAALLLDVLDRTSVVTDAQKDATRGFATTIMAYDLLIVILTRDRFGAPIDIPADPNADPAPVVAKDQVFARVNQLLDEGRTQLQRAGTTPFPFRLTTGLNNFSTPANFIRLNRALKARVAIYNNDWNGALSALGESFLNRTLPLEYGAYHVYSDRSGDATNPVYFLDRYFAHRRLRDNAQLRDDGSRDLRVQRKLTTVTPITVLGNTSDLQFTNPSSPSSPIAWIKNEELILLRAEANIGLGNRTAALDDINFVRVNSGGLPPLPSTFAGDLIDELLYNKLLSLVWEWGHAWLDARHYNRLTRIPVGTGDPRVFDVLPFPTSECLPRNPQPAGCATINGVR
jgi:hypothetical protein